MKRNQNPPADAELRRRAEERLREKQKSQESKAGDQRTAEDAERLVHELEVHQIELEMQNAELRRVQEDLEKLRAKYFDLYDLAPVGYLTLSAEGLILEANLTAANLLGIEKGQLVKKAVTHFIAKEDQDVYYLHCQKLFGTRAPQVCELRMMGPGGALFWAQLDAILLGDAASDAPLCSVGISDITARKQVEEELRRAKASAEEANRELQLMFTREQQFARTDALTGVNNRRYWLELAEHEFETAARYRHPSP